jgi:hypothetical protein
MQSHIRLGSLNPQRKCNIGTRIRVPIFERDKQVQIESFIGKTETDIRKT